MNNDGTGYVCFDPILGELTCKTCFYQAYGKKLMQMHINQNHEPRQEVPELRPTKQPELVPEPEAEPVNYEAQIPLLRVELKSPKKHRKTKKLPFVAEAQEGPIDPGFSCKDVVLGEFTCNTCGYTGFQKKKMIKHVTEKHSLPVDVSEEKQSPCLDDMLGTNAKKVLKNTDLDFATACAELEIDLRSMQPQAQPQAPSHAHDLDKLLGWPSSSK
jgi:hypothetical protein